MTTEEDMLFESFKAWLGLALANGAHALRENLSDDVLKRWVAGYDVIMAVYPDLNAPMGLQMFPVKGGDAFSTDQAKDLRSNAIPCANEADALALLAYLGGDPSWAGWRSTAAPSH